MSENQEAEVVTAVTRAPMAALRGKKYEKVGGSISCGDEVATALAGVDHEALFEFANSVGVETAKYDHLNAGQKRMNVGNRLRNLVKKGEVTVEQLAALPRAPEPVKATKAEAANAEEAA
ncbi:hypothetical protein RZS08_09565 [Arthrospira platensis SPKY1]|nr:hypothetical protein [Arthrospira platensis SPKY1]